MTRPLLSALLLAGLWACHGPKDPAPTEAPVAEPTAGVPSSGVVPAADVGKAPVAEDAGADAGAAAEPADGPDTVGGSDGTPAQAADATAPDRAAPTKGGLPCEGITSGLAAWMGGAKARVGTDAQGRASVVVALAAAETALPDSFEESARRERTAYGHVAAADVCTLATTPGVQSVRAADLADSK